MLVGAGLRGHIRIISSGKTATGFDILEKIILGADTVNAARSMMMAIGCVQAKACNTNNCPSGVATQDAARARAIDVNEKSQRVKSFQHGTVHSFLELVGAMGYNNPGDLTPSDLLSRHESSNRNFAEIYTPLLENQLLGDSAPDEYLHDWLRASAASF